MCHFTTILFSLLLATIFTSVEGLDPNERTAICLLPEVDKLINCFSPCDNRAMDDRVHCTKNQTNIESISFSKGKLSGTIPTQYGIFTSLLYMNLNDNKLTGPIPTQLGNLTAISSLSMRNNSLAGTIPSELGKLTNLTTLDLSNNQLSGTIPAQIMNLTKLILLNVSNNLLDLSSIPQYPEPQPNNPQYPEPQPNNPQYPDPQPNNPQYPEPQLNYTQLNSSLEVDQILNLSDKNIIFQTVNISGSLLLTKNVNLTTTRINLSGNSTLSITNSTVFVQENITIPTGFTLTITNPTTTSLETSNSLNIQSNTTLNIILPPNFTLTNDLTLISFKNITGTFTNVNINNECFQLVKDNIALILSQNSNPQCTLSSSTQETITISLFAILFISLLY